MAKMKIVVELELDQEAYDKEHGPGSEYWNKYRNSPVRNEHGDINHAETDAEQARRVEEYKDNHSERGTAEAIVDCLLEGFYDWQWKGWLKIEVQGHSVCNECGAVDRHKDYCGKIAGPEASA